METQINIAPVKGVNKRAPQYGMGAGYKRRKKIKRARGSETAGSTKCESCQANYLHKHFAGKSRAYKTIGYSQWCVKMDARIGRA